jgi:SOS-response transcriptional repressor LexA
VNGEFTVTRLYKRNGEIRLVPENKAYPPIEVYEGMDVEIWGVVRHVSVANYKIGLKNRRSMDERSTSGRK